MSVTIRSRYVQGGTLWNKREAPTGGNSTSKPIRRIFLSYFFFGIIPFLMKMWYSGSWNAVAVNNSGATFSPSQLKSCCYFCVQVQYYYLFSLLLVHCYHYLGRHHIQSTVSFCCDSCRPRTISINDDVYIKSQPTLPATIPLSQNTKH